MNDDTEVKKLLKKAAGVLQRLGLAKGIQQDEKGRVCVYGALMVAAGKTPNEELGGDVVYRAAEKLELSLGLEPRKGWNAADWNNEAKRTKRQVVAALKKAAA